jgi:hypothetical protein
MEKTYRLIELTLKSITSFKLCAMLLASRLRVGKYGGGALEN